MLCVRSARGAGARHVVDLAGLSTLFRACAISLRRVLVLLNLVQTLPFPIQLPNLPKSTRCRYEFYWKIDVVCLRFSSLDGARAWEPMAPIWCQYAFINCQLLRINCNPARPPLPVRTTTCQTTAALATTAIPTQSFPCMSLHCTKF